jgi:DNA modification methylase
MGNLKILYQDPSALHPRARNPRTHSKKQIRQIANSIKEFGFTNPILVDSDNGIIAGHGRVDAAQLLGIAQVPTLRFDHMTQAQIRAYVIADNRLAEVAGWDHEILAVELKELSVEVDLDVTVTGFDTPQIDLLIAELNQGDPDEGDEVPDIDRSSPAVTRPGDVWQIGHHRLLCADSTKAESYARLLTGDHAQMVFTDPPYNVRIDGHVSGLGKVKHREFAMATGEMSRAEFTAFLQAVFGNLAKFSADGAIHFVCMDWRHIAEVLEAAEPAYAEFKNLCVWAKTNAGMGSLYRSQHELVFVFKHGTATHINNVELGRHGRNRTNLWSYAGANTFSQSRDEELAMHPTVKPVALVADAIQDCSHRNGIVLDAFAGSGTTLIAAEKMGRRGFGIELDPHYVDTIVRRFEVVYGLQAVHEATSRDFTDIARVRVKEREAVHAG